MNNYSDVNILSLRRRDVKLWKQIYRGPTLTLSVTWLYDVITNATLFEHTLLYFPSNIFFEFMLSNPYFIWLIISLNMSSILDTHINSHVNQLIVHIFFFGNPYRLYLSTHLLLLNSNQSTYCHYLLLPHNPEATWAIGRHWLLQQLNWLSTREPFRESRTTKQILIKWFIG